MFNYSHPTIGLLSPYALAIRINPIQGSLLVFVEGANHSAAIP